MAYSVYAATSATTPSNLTPPDAPADLKATPGTDRVTLRWTASTGATGYVVEQRSGATWEQVYSGPNAIATITGLTPETDYEFRVKAVNDEGDSAWSAVEVRTRAVSTGGEKILIRARKSAVGVLKNKVNIIGG